MYSLSLILFCLPVAEDELGSKLGNEKDSRTKEVDR